MWRKFPSEDVTSHHCLWGSKKWCMYFSFQVIVQLFSAIWVICLNWISSALSAAGVVPDFTPPTCRPFKKIIIQQFKKKNPTTRTNQWTGRTGSSSSHTWGVKQTKCWRRVYINTQGTRCDTWDLMNTGELDEPNTQRSRRKSQRGVTSTASPNLRRQVQLSRATQGGFNQTETGLQPSFLIKDKLSTAAWFF